MPLGRPAALVFSFLALQVAPALAADGVIEINHERALAGAITSIDGPGYPVWLVAGSFRLTGDLSPPAGVNGIEIPGTTVYLDLNGFGVIGPSVCRPGNCTPGTSVGIRATSSTNGLRVTVVNGRIRGFGSDCIRLSSRVHLERLDISACGDDGIELSGGGNLVLANRVTDTGADGIDLSGGGLFRDNVVESVGLAGPGVTVVGGTATGGNLCDDGRCSPRGERRYYLTAAEYTGAQALGACDPGFHMASIFEIFDTSHLIYDERGDTFGDRGEGPPGVYGWIRTANAISDASDTGPGSVNCAAYTTNDPSHLGTQIIPLGSVWTATGVDTSPWNAAQFFCDDPSHVWCVQD
jgi:hypothetical protein